ncbi:GNAT family protein [Planococcus sp. N028]|uniref:GNAT family protein n=1 Tax=Planococcus shixiaomingii TaxID=3058393 RepID=A0ABT8N3G0_9BACL|nr:MULTISPECIES: GNAT family protein [unclassified Planococcus (in: firmicutes)]MDN7242411.1 GNAT family protein [Planococcus sp. N028]WKA54652.1 GNAT family protein [Planococcus sp. N022]
MEFPTLETERIDLVQIGQQHVAPFFDIMSRDEVTKYYGMDSLMSPEEAVRIIGSFQTTFELNRGIRWGIVLKENGRFAGTIGLNNLNIHGKKAEVGYELHPDYWGKGLIREANEAVMEYAFTELDLFRIGAVTFPDNTASSSLLKKLGFMEEGRLRGYLYQRHQSHDALVFSLLKPEWLERTSKEGA